MLSTNYVQEAVLGTMEMRAPNSRVPQGLRASDTERGGGGVSIKHPRPQRPLRGGTAKQWLRISSRELCRLWGRKTHREGDGQVQEGWKGGLGERAGAEQQSWSQGKTEAGLSVTGATGELEAEK